MSAYYNYSKQSAIKYSYLIILFILIQNIELKAQYFTEETELLLNNKPVSNSFSFHAQVNVAHPAVKYNWLPESETKIDTVPKPKSVMLQSLILPGWGQTTNKQWWKIPIIYSALAGVGYYVYWLDGQYKDFRAAYYNSFASTNPNYADQKFGATPSRLATFPQSALLSYRNYYRNERDFMLIIFMLTYGLNVVDAYIFAQLRDFDVSDNLSLRMSPVLYDKATGFNLTVTF
ncbi:hypothetical protein EP331_10585 [bacterium]|nr:MAG: hypothetical protein EP331_10585 [bacterium]